jgi:glycosyltransferase involved in cell wall biosynthesis
VDNQPDISIVMPVHGDAIFFESALQSCIESNDVSIEILVVLDRPSTHTRKLAKSYSLSLSNMRVLESAIPGISAALNLGIQNARSEFVARLDSDDLMVPSRLKIQKAVLMNNSEIDCCGSQVVHINESNLHIRKSNYPLSSGAISTRLTYTNSLAHSAVMFRKSIVLAQGGYRSIYDGAEDYDLWLRLNNQQNLINVPEYLTYFRIHEHQSAQNHPEKSLLLSSKIRLNRNCLESQLHEKINSGLDLNSHISVLNEALKFCSTNEKVIISGELVNIKFSMFQRSRQNRSISENAFQFITLCLSCCVKNFRRTATILNSLLRNSSL